MHPRINFSPAGWRWRWARGAWLGRWARGAWRGRWARGAWRGRWARGAWWHMDVNALPMHVERMHAERSVVSVPDQVLPRRPCLRLAPETAALVLLPSQRHPPPPLRRQVRLARRGSREREALAMALSASAQRLPGMCERPAAAARGAGRHR